ncbi:MAG TPA: hypothetical protein PLF32_03120 [Bacteroidales bacterium]|nr:hypothetical protein [Bacteroidales bacterium]HON20791.1 hypothetical protein [Bacteroidales bacterium]HOR81630.1 hypothetical protein [Bacteroidales bacterium]HPJ90862.1 hypothetical protein [Bacteroidales bacterium]
MDNKKQNLIFKSWMCETAIIFFILPVALLPLYFGKPTLLVVIIILIIGYFWFAFAIRLFYVYEDGIEIFFPLRFKPIYKKRKNFISYSEIKEIHLHSVRIERIQIILFRKCNFLWFKKNDTFFLWLDARRKKRNAILRFFKTKGIKIIVKPSWAITSDSLED